ncbi:MAG: membrane protein insertase YidC [Coriobacteriaceae bacterium]|nr:membrane protein insertase YidC [Coriobacteriaceae bacterium]
MESFINAIGMPLGYLMYGCFELLRNYGAAILLFTLLTKVILFPLSVIAQKNSIKMVKMQPELADIKLRNSGNGELIMQDTRALYKKERYSTVKGILPLLVQIPLILGLIDVIYNPLRHLLHLDSPTIAALTGRTAEVLGLSVDALGFGSQIRVLETVQNSPDAFAALATQGEGSLAGALAQIASTDTSFLGIDLAAIPQLGDLTLVVPILSALSALVLCLVQNRYNVLQAEAGFLGKWGMTIFLVAFSGYFALVLPCGLGLYWTAGNLLSIPVLALCNLIYSPKKYIDYATRVKPVRPTRAQRSAERARRRELAGREKADSRRFFAKGLTKNLVVYAEGGGYWKYFSALVSYVTAHSDIVVHYVTGDPEDRVLEAGDPQVVPYYIGPKALVAFMMKMDADIVVMTTPDLELFQIKRSLVRKDVEYIYLDHSMTSFQLVLRKGALDHFDTVFVYGPNHIDEVRETEKLYQLPPKTLVKTGYGLLDDLLERVAALEQGTGAGADSAGSAGTSADAGVGAGSAGAGTSADAAPGGPAPAAGSKQILIAPSWQADNLMELGIDDILKALVGHGYRIVVRPHPEYVKRFPVRMQAIIDRWAGQCAPADATGGTLAFETDFSSNETVYLSDLVITDWSTIAQEFSYATKKPSLFVNTPMKVMNPEYDRLPLVPLDISLRDELGVSVDLDELEGLAEVCADLLERSGEYREHITAVLERNIYDRGDAARGGGDYLIARVKEIEYLRFVGKDPARFARPAQLEAAERRKEAVRQAAWWKRGGKPRQPLTDAALEGQP